MSSGTKTLARPASSCRRSHVPNAAVADIRHAVRANGARIAGFDLSRKAFDHADSTSSNPSSDDGDQVWVECDHFVFQYTIFFIAVVVINHCMTFVSCYAQYIGSCIVPNTQWSATILYCSERAGSL